MNRRVLSPLQAGVRGALAAISMTLMAIPSTQAAEARHGDAQLGGFLAVEQQRRFAELASQRQADAELGGFLAEVDAEWPAASNGISEMLVADLYPGQALAGLDLIAVRNVQVQMEDAGLQDLDAEFA